MNRYFITLRLPFGVYVHYGKGSKMGQSRPSFGNGLVHYDYRRRVKSKTVRTFTGEPNHYDTQGDCIGYSRCENLVKLIHYDCRGWRVGYTYRFLGLIFIHRLSQRSALWETEMPNT